jgi:hypothetical protein
MEVPTGKDELPTPTWQVPGALTSSTSKSGVPSDVEVFEPFRASLDVAASVLGKVYQIIDAINANPIPDSYSGDFGTTGQRVAITLDEARDYAKRIDFFKDAASESAKQPYMRIEYNKGVVKGIVRYWDEQSPTPLSDAGTIVAIVVSYDGTIAAPVLEFEATLRTGTAGTTYPVSLWYRGEYASTGTSVSGGVGYHYVFDPDPANNPDKYEADHAYMYQAKTSADGAMANVCLYFPGSSATMTLGTDSVDAEFLAIVRVWVNLPGNGVVRANLDLCDPDGAGPLTGIRYTDTDATFKQDLEDWVLLNEGNPNLDALIFVLDLVNPIAYSNDTGYVGNGASVPADYTALGDPSSIAFTKGPDDVFGLTIAAPAE